MLSWKEFINLTCTSNFSVSLTMINLISSWIVTIFIISERMINQLCNSKALTWSRDMRLFSSEIQFAKTENNWNSNRMCFFFVHVHRTLTVGWWSSSLTLVRRQIEAAEISFTFSRDFQHKVALQWKVVLRAPSFWNGTANWAIVPGSAYVPLLYIEKLCFDYTY